MLVKPKPKPANSNDEDRALPLRKIEIDTKIEGAFATVDLFVNYVNPCTDTILEAKYEFPLDKNTLLAKLEA